MKNKLSFKFYLTLLLLVYCHIFNLRVTADDQINIDKTKQLDLEASLNIALDKNTTILESIEDNKVYQLKVKENVCDFLPTFGVQTSYQLNSVTKNIDIPSLGISYSSLSRSQAHTSVGLIQPISNIYKTGLLQKIQNDYLRISDMQVNLDKNAVAISVTNKYFDIIKQKKLIALYKQNIVKLEEYYKVSLSRYDNGDALSSDYLRIKYQIDSAKQDLFVAENSLNLFLHQFNQLLGLDLSDKIDIVENYNIEDFSVKPLDELKEIALNNRLEIKQAQKNIDIARLDKKAQYIQYIPNISLSSYFYNSYNSGQNGLNNFILSVSANYTLWDWNKRGYILKEKESDIKKQQLKFVDTQNNVVIDVLDNLNQAKAAYNLIGVSKNNVEYSAESLRITKNRYYNGLALVIDLLSSQTDFLSAQINLASSEIDFQKSLIQLQKSLGILIK